MTRYHLILNPDPKISEKEQQIVIASIKNCLRIDDSQINEGLKNGVFPLGSSADPDLLRSLTQALSSSSCSLVVIDGEDSTSVDQFRHAGHLFKVEQGELRIVTESTKGPIPHARPTPETLLKEPVCPPSPWGDVPVSKTFSLQELFQQGFKAMETKSWKIAEQSFQQVLALNPNQFEAHLNLGNVYFEQKKFTEAERHYRTVTQLQPSFSGGYYNLGTTLLAQRAFAQAKEVFVEVLNLEPNHAGARKGLAKVEQQSSSAPNSRRYDEQFETVDGVPLDMDPDFRELFIRCKPFSLTYVERLYALYKAVEYVIKNDIPGDFVECGVWQGGSAMLIALTLLKYGDTSRSIYLYDTYAGMSEPTEHDTARHTGAATQPIWEQNRDDSHNRWMYVPLETVRRNLLGTGYPEDKLMFVKGDVLETIPKTLPKRLALLRLDTDWYQSTYHELLHLYPRLEVGGVLIVDDYGHFEGARKAVDQWQEETKPCLLFNRVDYTGRVGVRVR